MTLTDREIAILHLALQASGTFKAMGNDTPWETHLAFCGDLFELGVDGEHNHAEEFRRDCVACEVISALAIVPLYRHAFGIEAPERYDIGTGYCIRTVERDGTVCWGYERKPSPASLAIANALSRTRG